MSEYNTIYDNSENIVGILRHGVAWDKDPEKRLGEYDDEFVYNNNTEVLAKISDNIVVDIIGETIGHISGKELYLAGEKVGNVIGSTSAGLAAIVLMFSRYANENS